MIRKIYPLFAVGLLTTPAWAQHNNELFVQGDMFIQNGAIVHVMGDVSISTGGALTNQGLMEVQGHWTRSGTGSYTSTTGTVEFRNDDVNTADPNNITGDMTGANSFFNLVIDNRAAAVANNVVALLTANAQANGTVVFTNGRLRTDAVGRGSNGAAYLREFYVNNTAPASMVGYAMAGTTRYVEGKLARQVSGAQTYDFPIGIEPSFLDGEEPFRLTFTSAPNDKLTTWFQPATQALIAPGNNRMNFDMGRDPVGFNINDPFSSCIGGPDGVLDQAIADLNRSHEWVVNRSGAVNTFNYRIDVFPGPVFDPNTYLTATCGGNTQTLKWLAKDGVPGGTPIAAVGASQPALLPAMGWGTAATPCPPTGNTLTNQTGFSIFRLHGTTIFSNTVLPISLLNLQANAVDNRFIRVDWTTAKEEGVDYFEIERSTDGVNFEYINTTSPATGGFSSNPLSYYINDNNVIANQDYYYRIKTINIDETHEYSHAVTAALTGENLAENVLIFPNPVEQGNVNVTIASLKGREANIKVFNAIGQLVHSQPINMQTGNNQYAINTDHWASAVYFIQISGEDFTVTKEFVKHNR